MITLHLGILLFSFLISSILIVPFINFSFRYFHKKSLPPTGGIFMAILIPTLSIILLPILQRLGIYIHTSYPLIEEVNIILFTFVSFSVLGMAGDLFPQKISHTVQLIIGSFLSLLIASILYINLNISFLNLPNFGTLSLGPLIIPFAAGVIMLFSTSFKKTNHIDGLVPGILMISLIALWIISVTMLDTPLSIFTAVWIGSLLAFLYFTVYPARISLGQTGTLGFGATFALVGLLLGKSVALFVIGGLFFANPIFIKLSKLGWSEPKIMMRSWLIGLMLAVFGLWLALL